MSADLLEEARRKQHRELERETRNAIKLRARLPPVRPGGDRPTVQARNEYDPETIQAIANTSVIGLQYRTKE